MTFNEHLTQFAGREVEDFDQEKGIRDPAKALRVSLDWDSFDAGKSIQAAVEALVADPLAGDLRALIVGAWDFEASLDSSTVVTALVAGRERLVALEALFLGDIIYEEQECSWIQHGSIEPLFSNFPNLRTLRVRGAEGLALGNVRHAHLESFAIETGGLRRELIPAIIGGELPALRRLELWLGDGGYGRTTEVADVEPLLRGKLPALSHLGLCNAENVAEIVELVAKAELAPSLRTLDLSKGVLEDAGAQPLVDAAGRLGQLEALDLGENYLSEDMLAKLRSAGLPVVDSPQREAESYGDEEYRYVVVTE